ncbi:MAG: 50S ribosomal protein L6 [Chloroflexia bacterium]|nr:50S ribosomal protein L6 [Chloroflexia bacterium]
MSRVGKKPIPVPQGVEISIKTDEVVVKGPKGVLRQPLLQGIDVSLEGAEVLVRRQSDAKPHRARHGLMRSLIANMVTGVTDGFSKELQIVGTGYRAELDGLDLVLQLGFSHPVRIVPPEGITFEVAGRNDRVIVSGSNKVLVGQQAANIRALRKPEPYLGKGVRYLGEYVRRKAGKAGKV